MVRRKKINLIENDIWEDVNGNSITIIKCYYDEDIVEILCSNSMTSREYKIPDVINNIIDGEFLKNNSTTI